MIPSLVYPQQAALCFFRTDYFFYSRASVQQVLLCFLVYINPTSRQTVEVCSNNAPLYSGALLHACMSYIPAADAGMHPVSPSVVVTQERVRCHNRTSKPNKLFSERVAPKHIGYIQTSKNTLAVWSHGRNRSWFHSRTHDGGSMCLKFACLV